MQLCSEVLSGKWLDAQRAAATVSLRVDFIPSLWFKAPPPSRFCQRWKGRASSCLHGPGPRSRVPSLVARAQAGREDMWTQVGAGDIFSGPLCWKHWDFLGEVAPGCWRQGLAGERKTHQQTRGSPPTFPPNCSQGGHRPLLAARTKMFLSVLNILYSFCF